MTWRQGTRARRFVPRALLAAVLCVVVSVAAFVVLPPHSAHAWSRGHDTIILVHGFDGDPTYGGSSGFDCNGYGQYDWGPVLNYLQNYHNINGQSLQWYRQDFRTISFYRGDYDCGRVGVNAPADTYPYGYSSEDLHNPLYTQHCSGYYPDGTNASEDGTNNESIYHLSCLFAWYLYLNFQPSWNVEIVAHSMGGLIVRNSIYQIWKSMATWTMPPTLPNISDVVTLSSPHGGVPPQATWFVCSGCKQVAELQADSSFMTEMDNSAQTPQAGSTDWTMIGSQCDPYVPAGTANGMIGGHKSFFNTGTTPCYDHAGILADESDAYNASISWCDGCGWPGAPGSSYWNEWNAAPHSLHHMMYALWLTNW